MKFPVGLKRAATLIMLRNEDHFLLLKRLKPPHQGRYTPVGGKLDPHERPLEAAIRELREETGIELESLTFAGILTETSPVKYNWICYAYVADIERVPPPPCNEGELEWVALADMHTLPAPETDAHIYRYIMEGKPFVLDANYDAELKLIELKDELTGELLPL